MRIKRQYGQSDMKQTNGKKFTVQKIALFTLSIILAVGLLSHSVVHFCLDIFLNPFSPLQKDEIALRLWARSLSEHICSVFCALYVLGLIVFAIKLKSQISAKKLALFLVFQLAIMGICTVPFAISSAFSGDYLVPIYAVVPSLLLISIIYFAASKIPYQNHIH